MTKSSPSVDKKRIIIGRIGAPHGVRGEVRVEPLTDFPNRFDGLQKVYAGEEVLSIEGVRHHGDKILIKFAGIDTPEAVKKLNGVFLKVLRKDAVPLKEGEYYTFDILGLEVLDSEGHFLGKVENILFTGSNDVYVVKNEEREVLIPALKKVVRSIDLEKGTMIVTPLEMME